MKDVCAFCGFELTDEDLRYVSPLDMWLHCKEHTNHASYPQLWLLKKEMGVPYVEPTDEQKICAVCELPLSEEDFKSVKKEHQNFTCRFHRRKAADFNLDRTREGLGYAYKLGIMNLMLKEWKL